MQAEHTYSLAFLLEGANDAEVQEGIGGPKGLITGVLVASTQKLLPISFLIVSDGRLGRFHNQRSGSPGLIMAIITGGALRPMIR